MPEFTFSGIAQYAGKELGVSSWVTVDQSRINQFAECSGDRQWIHVDVARAMRESPYRTPIAHGYLTLALVAPLQMEIGAVSDRRRRCIQLWPGQGALPCAGEGRRPGAAPRRTGQCRAEKRRGAAEDEQTLEIEGSDKPALIAESLALITPRVR